MHEIHQQHSSRPLKSTEEPQLIDSAEQGTEQVYTAIDYEMQ